MMTHQLWRVWPGCAACTHIGTRRGRPWPRPGHAHGRSAQAAPGQTVPTACSYRLTAAFPTFQKNRGNPLI